MFACFLNTNAVFSDFLVSLYIFVKKPSQFSIFFLVANSKFICIYMTSEAVIKTGRLSFGDSPLFHLEHQANIQIIQNWPSDCI